MEIQTAVTSLGALAQKSRLAIFRFMVERGQAGATPGELVQHFDISPSALSFHLKALLHAGLINAEQVSRSITYRTNYDAMQGLIDYLTENCCGGDPSQCAPVRKKAVTMARPGGPRLSQSRSSGAKK